MDFEVCLAERQKLNSTLNSCFAGERTIENVDF